MFHFSNPRHGNAVSEARFPGHHAEDTSPMLYAQNFFIALNSNYLRADNQCSCSHSWHRYSHSHTRHRHPHSHCCSTDAPTSAWESPPLCPNYTCLYVKSRDVPSGQNASNVMSFSATCIYSPPRRKPR